MSLAVSMSVSRSPDPLVASTPSLLFPHFLADLYRAATLLSWDDLAAYRVIEQAGLTPHLPYFREIGCVTAAEILEAFLQGKPIPRGDFPAQATNKELVAMALAHVMIALESQPGQEGLATLMELHPPSLPSPFEVRDFMRRFGLGSGAVRRSPRGLLLDAMGAALRGGVPEMTLLTEREVAMIQGGLETFGFPGVVVPHVFHWRPHRKMRGVGHAKPLLRNPEDGTTVVPVFLTPGAAYAEHIHLGREELIQVSGQIANGHSAHIIHTPHAEGEEPAVYVGIVWGGVVFTGFPGTWGADLVARYGIAPETVAAVFRDIPPDGKEARPRRDLARYLFAVLEGRDPIYEARDIADGVDRLGQRPPENRLEFARERSSRLIIMPGLTD